MKAISKKHATVSQGEHIQLTLREKLYLIAVFGDLPMYKREKLFLRSSMPAQCGPAVIQAGFDFVEKIKARKELTEYLTSLGGKKIDARTNDPTRPD